MLYLQKQVLTEVLRFPFIYSQLKFTDAPASSCVPAAPTLFTVNEIKLIDPLALGKLGVEPDGNKK